MLSSRSRYALRALSYLAQKAPAPQTTEQIASATGLPLPTLAKILQVLSPARIVKTQRGVGGGVELARRPELISVKEIVDTVDTASCPDIFGSSADCRCLQRRLRVVRALAELVLEETKISELTGNAETLQEGPVDVDAILEHLVQSVPGLVKKCKEQTAQ